MTQFNKLVGTKHLEFDDSPFIQLTANPQYVDVLCVNCYECVKHVDVDHHSEYCRGIRVLEEELSSHGREQSSLSEENSMLLEKEAAIVNDKIDKLGAALRMRLIEIEYEDTKAGVEYK